MALRLRWMKLLQLQNAKIHILSGQVSKGGEEIVMQELQSPQVGFKISHHCGFDKNKMIV